MDDRMPAAGHPGGDRADVHLLPGVRRGPLSRRVGVIELPGRLRIGVSEGVWIGRDEIRQPRRVTVIGMLVGDQDRVESGDALETVGEVSRIEQDLRPIEFDQQTRMTEVRELHASTVLPAASCVSEPLHNPCSPRHARPANESRRTNT